ncbi:MAG: hypothetical protein AB1779_02185 [Candidatus Thermoplasmatota archaeon]
MIPRNGNIVFPKRIKYKDLAPIFPQLLRKFLDETNQLGDDDNYVESLIRNNVNDLKKNKKPEGYIRNNKMRLIFPITKGEVKFYVYRATRSEDVTKVTKSISKFLKSKHIPHKVNWDEMLLYKIKSQKQKPTL